MSQTTVVTYFVFTSGNNLHGTENPIFLVTYFVFTLGNNLHRTENPNF